MIIRKVQRRSGSNVHLASDSPQSGSFDIDASRHGQSNNEEILKTAFHGKVALLFKSKDRMGQLSHSIDTNASTRRNYKRSYVYVYIWVIYIIALSEKTFIKKR